MFNLSPQDIIDIQEAYQSVYLQEDVEQLDELIGAAIGAGMGYLAGKAGQGFVQGLRGGGDKSKPTPSQSRFAGARDQAVAKARQIQGSPVVGSRPSPAARPSATTPASRPSGGSSAPAARPAASAPIAKPSPTPSASAPAKPTPAPSTPAAKPSAMDQWAKANPRLAQVQQIRKQGGSRAEVNKALYNKGTAAATSTPTVVKASYDMFDAVKGYLIDEGFAETEQAAIAIMANMSEGWKSEIINKVND